MRAVSLEEFKTWLKANKHRTWYNLIHWGEGVAPATCEIKYFDICLDTRTMEIWSITSRGHDELSIRDTNENDSKTILDGLTELLDEAKREKG